MQTTISSRDLALEPLSAPDTETEKIVLLSSVLQIANIELASDRVKLVIDTTEITLPQSVYQALSHIVNLMASGKAVSIIYYSHELTTQQAADLLNVSRPYLIKLLEQGEIPYNTVGTHRRVPFDELMKYKKQRDTKRSELLQQLIELTEEEGLYEDEA
ncbi:MAG TPA: helix-turn-helix domain-containing protein [Nostocaceae cyanobacterium]|nr:helix-turn-helix domain-containing protein [Nostocaceae cyanobacterium]